MKQGENTLDGFPQDVTETLIAYLSRDLSVDRREAFEARILEDEFFSQQIEQATVALLDAYTDGSLPRELHKRLTPWVSKSGYGRQHIAVNRSLQQMSSRSARRGSRKTIWTLAVAACLLLAAVPMVLVRRHTAPSLVAKLEPKPGPAKALAPSETTILLVAQRLRSAEPHVQSPGSYRIRRDFPVRLQIVLPSSRLRDSYSVTIRSSNSKTLIAQFAAVRVQGPTEAPYVEIVLPPNTLASAEYTADVYAPDDVFRLQFSTDSF